MTTDQSDTAVDPSVDFLQHLCPGGPWVLTAIPPGGSTITITAHDPEEVLIFKRRHDGTANRRRRRVRYLGIELRETEIDALIRRGFQRVTIGTPS